MSLDSIKDEKEPAQPTPITRSQSVTEPLYTPTTKWEGSEKSFRTCDTSRTQCYEHKVEPHFLSRTAEEQKATTFGESFFRMANPMQKTSPYAVPYSTYCNPCNIATYYSPCVSGWSTASRGACVEQNKSLHNKIKHYVQKFKKQFYSLYEL